MEYGELGRSGLHVSRMCFGALTIGPLQRNLSLEEGSGLIRTAFELGINFLDTAELYGTYPYIKQALKGWSNPEEIVVATKSYAYTAEGMRSSLEQARRELGLDTIPIFLLHEQESEHTIKGHWPALEALFEAQAKGQVKAIGISTHHVSGVLAACKHPEIQIISPLINLTGMGIQAGSRADMLAAISQASAMGKGIYAMKPLGGGHLIARRREAFSFLLDLPEVHSIAVGMKSLEELERNIAYFKGKPLADEEFVQPERKLHFDDWCIACGKCVDVCTAQALTLESGQVVVDREKCVFCGYCGAACPEFAIKVI